MAPAVSAGLADFASHYHSYAAAAGGGVSAFVEGAATFLGALGLSGSKIADDFGNRGLRGYAMLLVVLAIYAAAIAMAFA